MNKFIITCAIALGFIGSVQAQTYDLVKTTWNVAGKIESSGGYFTHTGTMEINGSTVTRTFELCIIEQPCDSSTYVDEILGATDKNAILRGDSGDLVSIHILSLSPRLILFYYGGNVFSLDEYKLRQ